MKKIIVILIVVIAIFNNSEKVDENFFKMNLFENQLNYNQVYFFDLNGDKINEEIILKSYNDKKNNFVVDLYINDKLKEKYKDKNNINVYIYDFYKIDNQKEIYITLGDNIQNSKSNIFIYSNDNKSNNFSIHGSIINNNDKSGNVVISNATTDDLLRYENYSKVIGEDYIRLDNIQKRIFDDKFVDVEEKEIKVAEASKGYEYVAKEEVMVYETNIGHVNAYILSNGDKISLVSLYNHGKEKCIKIVNKEGRYGWIKVYDKQLFEPLKK